jgi:hypothetical protein
MYDNKLVDMALINSQKSVRELKLALGRLMNLIEMKSKQKFNEIS